MMAWLTALKASSQKVSLLTQHPSIREVVRYKSSKKELSSVSHRKPSPCVHFPPDSKECFDTKSVTIERGNACHARLIRSFLNTHFWPMEPSVVGLWIDLNSPYLKIYTERYANSGDRLLAFERVKRTNEKKLVGFCAANRMYPWMIDELEEWAHVTCSKPEKHRMYFCAHCLKSPNFYKKYNVDFIYEIEILGTTREATGHGVSVLLLKTALAHAEDLRYPLVQVVAVSQYTARICESCGMKRAWTMDYSEFVDDAGQRVFFPRRPHHNVGIYVKYFDPKKSLVLPCKPPF